MRRTGIDLDQRLAPGHHPLGAEEDRVVQERVLRPTREQRGGKLQAREVLVHGRDGGVLTLLGRHPGQEGGEIVVHEVLVEDEDGRAFVGVLGWRAAQIIAAEVEQEALEAEAGVLLLGGFEQVQRDAGREVAAGALAADEAHGGTESGVGVVDQPFGGVVAIVWSGREGVFGCEAVANRDTKHARIVGNQLQCWI